MNVASKESTFASVEILSSVQNDNSVSSEINVSQIEADEEMSIEESSDVPKARKNAKPVALKLPDGTIQKFQSMSEAAEKTQISKENIRKWAASNENNWFFL